MSSDVAFGDSAESPLVGHHDARADFLRAVEQELLSHALLIVGEEGIGKRKFVEWAVSLLWCSEPSRPCGACSSCSKVETGNHPDLTVLSKAPSEDADPRGVGSPHEITVGQVRHYVIDVLRLMPAEASCQAVVIAGADEMNEGAQNALLKTLEDPPGSTQLFLVSSRPDRLLDTLRSRCQEWRLSPLSDEETKEVLPDADAGIVRLVRGRPGIVGDFGSVDLVGLLEKFDGCLTGVIPGSVFSEYALNVIKQGTPEGALEGDVHQAVLGVLHARVRDYAQLAGGFSNDALTSDLRPLDRVSDDFSTTRMEKAVLDASDDMNRHFQPTLVWNVLGQALRSS